VAQYVSPDGTPRRPPDEQPLARDSLGPMRRGYLRSQSSSSTKHPQAAQPATAGIHKPLNQRKRPALATATVPSAQPSAQRNPAQRRPFAVLSEAPAAPLHFPNP